MLFLYPLIRFEYYGAEIYTSQRSFGGCFLSVDDIDPDQVNYFRNVHGSFSASLIEYGGAIGSGYEGGNRLVQAHLQTDLYNLPPQESRTDPRFPFNLCDSGMQKYLMIQEIKGPTSSWHYANADRKLAAITTPVVKTFNFQAGDIRITTDYAWFTDMNFNTKVKPGKDFSWTVGVSSGHLTVHVTTPSVGELVQSFPIPVGSQQTVQLSELPAGLASVEIFVSNSVTGIPKVEGPASLQKGQVVWNSEETKTFTASVSPNASAGERVVFHLSQHLDLTIGIRLNAAGLGSVNLMQQSTDYTVPRMLGSFATVSNP